MLKMVDGTGIIGQDLICPLGVSTPQPPNYDRVELEGAGMLVLPNSLDAPLERLELGGKTEQVTTTGKNLFDSNIAKNKENYKEVTIAGSVIYAIELSLKPNTKYAFQCVIKSVPTTMNVGNSTIRYVVSDGQKRVITTNEDGKLYIGFSGNPDGEIHKIGVSIVDIQVEESTTVTPYEPYTGGKPSPSPEYLQEIKNSGKWNEEKQKYEVNVKVTGKNLLNLQKEPDVKGIYQGWKCGNGEKITLSITDKNNNADISGCILGLSKNGDSANGGVIWAIENGAIKNKELTLTHPYVSVFPANEITIKKLTERFEIQCEYGSIATDYEPYKEQTLTLTSDRPITKWDRLVEQGGEIGWLYSTGVYEDIKESDISANNINDQYGRYYVNAIKAYKNAECMCNIAEYSPAQKENKCGFWWSDTLCFLISSEYTGNNGTEDNSTAIKNFKDNVLSKGITVFYKLNTEEFIPLPQEEQDAIRALKTYYPTTVITVDSGEVDPDIKVTYRKEI